MGAVEIFLKEDEMSNLLIGQKTKKRVFLLQFQIYYIKIKNVSY